LAIGLTSGAASIIVIVALPLIIGAVLYLISLRRTTVELSSDATGGTRRAKVGILICIIALSAASLAFHETAVRPHSYFVLMGIAATGILLQARAAETDRRVLVCAIIQALVLAALLRGQALFESPALTMSDIGAHKSTILAWQEAGHLMRFHPVYETWYGYYDWPFLHLAVIEASLLANVSFNAALFIAIGLPFVAALLFVYLIAERLTNRPAAIFAMVFAATAAPHIWWGAVLIPTSMGVTLFCGLLYLALVWRNSAVHTVVFLILGLSLVLTHTASSFITMGAVLAITVTGRLIHGRGSSFQWALAPLTCLFVFAIGILGRWLHAFHAPGLTFFQMVTGGLIDSLIEVAAPTANIVYSADQSPLNSLWIGFAATLFISGSLACLNPAVRSPRRLAGLAAVAVLCGVVVAFPLLGMRNVLPHRWLPFIFAGGAWLAVLGLTYVTTGFSARQLHLLQVVVMSAFIALSLFSTSVHPRTPLSSVPISLSWTASEAAAGSTIAGWSPAIITVDTHYIGLAGGFQANQMVEWSPLSASYRPRGLIVLRHSLRDTMRELSPGTWQAGQLGYNPGEPIFFDSLEDHPYSQVYKSRAVSAFLEATHL
jgi:hypothetical protein